MIQPFKLRGETLAGFVRSFADVTGEEIIYQGTPERDLGGTVTLFVSRPMPEKNFAELFHAVLSANGFSVVDAPGRKGWIVLKQRDARDLDIPLVDGSQVPLTYRLITTIHALKHVHAEEAARVMRSFMPGNSRIIPVSTSEVAITDSGRNVAKLLELLRTIDNPRNDNRDWVSKPHPQRGCPPRELKIDQLTVQKLEIQEPGATSGARPGPDRKPILPPKGASR